MCVPLFGLIALSLYSLALADTPPAVAISSITYTGSGCPPDSVGQFISANGEVFTLIFDTLQAAVGPGVAASQASELCDVTINFVYTPGWQFGTANTTWRGFAGLDAGVKGTSSVRYSLTNGGSTSSATTQATFAGPYSQQYAKTGFVGLSVSNNCKATLPVSMRVQVSLTSSVSTASGLLTSDTVDGTVGTSIATGLKWTKC